MKPWRPAAEEESEEGNYCLERKRRELKWCVRERESESESESAECDERERERERDIEGNGYVGCLIW